MMGKPDTCKECPLATTGKGFVPDQNVAKPAYVLVGEAPGRNEVETGKPFQGQAGFVLKNWLLKAVPQIQLAFEKGQVTVANTLKCLPPEIQGRAYPRGAEKEAAEACCAQYASWPQSSAHTIILFGESAQRRHFGPELDAEDLSDRRLGRDVKGVMGRIGREYEREGKRYVFAPHPAWILRQPSLTEHGQRSLQIAANTEKLVEVDYNPNWEEALHEMFVA